jgi:hypothetical protein
LNAKVAEHAPADANALRDRTVGGERRQLHAVVGLLLDRGGGLVALRECGRGGREHGAGGEQADEW